MLGRYDNFPTNIEGFARFSYLTSTHTLQKAIANALHKLNKQTIDMKAIAEASPTNCTVNFELGVAKGDTFNFLDEEELQQIEKTMKQRVLPVLDLYCVARYHTQPPTGKRNPLKCDYSMLRFAFGTNTMELFVYHERGIQRIPLEDLVTFLKNQINEQLTEKQHKTLTLKKVVKSQRMFSPQQPLELPSESP